MDLVGSILDSMVIPPSTSVNTQIKQNNPPYKCGICGKIFSNLHVFGKHEAEHKKLKNGYHQKQKLEKNASELPNKTSSELKKIVANVKADQSTTFKPSYKCDICGKIYTERKSFKNHKNNHKRNKKSGLHVFDKLSKVMHVKNFGLPAENTISELLPISSSPNEELQPTMSPQNTNATNNSQTKQLYKCPVNGCGKTFEKRKTYVNHKYNHTLNKKTGKHLFFDRRGEKVTKKI